MYGVRGAASGEFCELIVEHLALRRAWDAGHAHPAGAPIAQKRNTWTTASGPAVDQFREWFTAAVAPLLEKSPIAEIRSITGLSTLYVIMIRQGLVPHPRHYAALATLVGIEVPKRVCSVAKG